MTKVIAGCRGTFAGLAVAACVLSMGPLGRAQATAAEFQPSKEEVEQIQKAVELAQKDELQDSIDILDDLMEKRPQWIAVWIVRGQVLMKDQDYDLARKSFQEGVDRDAKNREALLGIAAASWKMEEYEKAMTALDKVVELYPADGQAAIMRAHVLVDGKKLEEAAKYIAAALTRVTGPERVAFLAALVPLQVQAGDFAGAEAGATEWIEGQRVVEAYVCRADARRGLKKFPEALADLAEGLKANEGRPTFALLYVSSQVQLEKGEAATAIAQLVDLLEMSPGTRAVETALARAVQGRVAQMKADPKEKDLVPQVDVLTNAARMEQWKLRALIGEERIARTLAKVNRAQRNALEPPYGAISEAKDLYPALELYATHLDMELIFDVKKETNSILPPEVEAFNTAQDFRIAAALAAVRYARHDSDGFILKSQAEGYLQWAEFEDRVREGKLNESDKLIVKGHELDEIRDDAGALEAWAEASRLEQGSFTGPSYSLSLRIKNDPERLSRVMVKWMKEVDAGLAKGDIKAAEKAAYKMGNASSTDSMPEAALAKVYRAKGDKAKAAEELESAISRNAFCADAELLRGEDLEAAGKLQEAMLVYNLGACGKQAAGSDDSPAVTKAIAARDRLEKARTTADLKMLYAKTANDNFASEDWTDAMAAANRMKWGFGEPQTAAFYTAGIAASHAWHYSEAVKDLTKAAEMNPKMPGYSALASAEAALFHWEAALKWYEIAIEMTPKDLDNYRERGDVYMELEKFDEARADFEKAIKLGDESSHTKLKLGACLEQVDPEAAVAHYKTVIANPGISAIFSSDERTIMLANAHLYLVQAELMKKKAK